MGRWCCRLAAGLCLAAAAVGCTTTKMSHSFAASGAKPDETAAEVLDRERDQPRADGSSTAGSEAAGSSFAGTKSRESGRGSGPARPAATTRDPETIALIERELSDASPAERESLLKTLRDLPDESVRRILSERRKGLQMAGRKPMDGAPRRGEPSRTGTVQPVEARNPTADESLVTPSRGHAPLGLGTVSAWGQSTTTRRSAVPPIETDGSSMEPADSAVRTADGHAEQSESRAFAVRHAIPESNHSVGHSSSYRTAASPDAQAAAPAKSPAASAPAAPAPGAAAAKGNPLLGYLIPGRFRTPPAITPKSGTAATPGGVQTASVALGAPREVAASPNAASGDGSETNRQTSDELLESLIAAAEAEITPLAAGSDDAQKQTYIEQQVYLRMLYLMSGHQERALQAIPGIDPVDQEFWQQTFWGLANYFDVSSMPLTADRATQTVSQMTKAVLRLQEKASLELRNVNFCHKIALFGSYDKYPRDEFRPGQEVLLYAEMANIHSEPTADGKFRTSLKSTLEIFRHGPQGESVDRIEFPEQIDLCRSHRRDYFNSYKYTMPTHLTLGPHVLKLTVEDQLSRRVATYSLNFMVK